MTYIPGGASGVLPSARASAPGTLSLANNVWVPWTAMAADYDSDGFFDAVGQQFVIPAGLAGDYLIIASFEFSNNVTGGRMVEFRVNGVQRQPEYESHPKNNSSINDSISQIIILADADAVLVRCRQNSGSTLTLDKYIVSISKMRS